MRILGKISGGGWERSNLDNAAMVVVDGESKKWGGCGNDRVGNGRVMDRWGDGCKEVVKRREISIIYFLLFLL